MRKERTKEGTDISRHPRNIITLCILSVAFGRTVHELARVLIYDVIPKCIMFYSGKYRSVTYDALGYVIHLFGIWVLVSHHKM